MMEYLVMMRLYGENILQILKLIMGKLLECMVKNNVVLYKLLNRL